MGIFDNDRPDGYDGSEEEPAIHPEALPPREKLAIDGEDLVEFAEGYDKGAPLAGEQGAP